MTTTMFLKRTVYLISAAVLLNMGCSSNESGEKVDCDDSDLSIEATPGDPTTCSSSDGTIELEASGGESPYQFSFNGAAFSENSSFDGLGAGTYVVTVKDKNGCERETDVVLTSPGSTIALETTVTEDAGCKTSDGSIVAEATGGTGPYTFQLNDGAFGAASEFNDLSPGTYTITVKDEEDCTTTSAAVKIMSGVSYVNDIKPLIENRCDHCHGPGGPKSDRDWTVYANVKAFAAAIKTRTGNGSMPADLAGGLPQAERDLIACWVDDGAPNN